MMRPTSRHALGFALGASRAAVMQRLPPISGLPTLAEAR